MTSEQKRLKESAERQLAKAQKADKGKVLLTISPSTTILVQADLVQTTAQKEQYRQAYLQKIDPDIRLKKRQR